jgi:hypothetical protein
MNILSFGKEFYMPFECWYDREDRELELRFEMGMKTWV